MEQEIQNHTDAIGHGEVDALTDPPAYDDEQSFCNCENNECITPYCSDDSDTDANPITESEPQDDTLETMHKAQTDKPNTQLQRLKNDFLAAGMNPYIKRDHTCRINLYRKKGDTEPIDCFESKSEHGFSARAMFLLGATLLGICLLIRLFGKEN